MPDNSNSLTNDEHSFIFSTLMLRRMNVQCHNEPKDIEMIDNIIKKYKNW